MGCSSSRAVIAADSLPSAAAKRIQAGGGIIDLSQPENAADVPPFPPFTVFPVHVLRQTNVVELRLARNGLEELPAAISALVNLKLLDLAGNRLSGLPVTLGTLTKLEELDASEVRKPVGFPSSP